LPGTEPELRAEDIQGNILPGFRRAQELLAGFTGTDLAALKQAVGALARHITALPAVLEHKDNRKRAFLLGKAPPPREELWVNFALGQRATDALGLQSLRAIDPSFNTGMIPSVTGDSTRATLADGKPNPAAPRNWVVGGPNRPLDLLLIFAADDTIEDRAKPLIDEISSFGLQCFYRDKGELLKDDVEHFGFQDGISQPGVSGTVTINGSKRFVTTRYGVPADHDVEFGKPAQPLQDPTQFLFDDSDPALANGAFLVFRRLRQDVAAFQNDSDELAAKLAESIEPGLTGAELRARIVGRWPSGQPLMRPTPPPHETEAALALNYFDFARNTSALVLTTGEQISGATGDPQAQAGGRCPVWAHIRKVNPRDMQTNHGGADETRGFQMLRRGIPFGPAYDFDNPANPVNRKERGLLFLAYQTSIKNQFDILNNDWMNKEKNPAAFGFDLLVGQTRLPTGEHGPKDADFFSAATGQTSRFSVSDQWVTPTGGAYLFAPSIAWTRKLATSLEAVV
jgi:Dyp-type peroxidase family